MSGSHAPTVGELMRAAVSAAIMAPSSHNTQPWRFRLAGTRLELLEDRARQLGVIDADRRQLVMSCGCALQNARLALRAAGYQAVIDVMDDRRASGLLAVIELGPPAPPTPAERALAEAIPLRRTNRRAFLARPVGATTTDALVEAARADGVAMRRLLPDEKRAIGELIDRADREQYGDPEFRAELARWLTPFGSRRRDGIPFVEKEYGSAMPFTVMRALRSPDLGGEFGQLEEELVNGAPVVMVMGTPTDGHRDWLRCGEVLQATLLRATTVGLSAAFLNQTLEIAALRAQVAALVPAIGHPQMIFRLGVPEEPVHHPAPRRSVDDVLEIAW